MRVKDGDNYVLVGSKGGAATNTVWTCNLRADGDMEVRDETDVHTMQVCEVEGDEERARLSMLSVATFSRNM